MRLTLRNLAVVFFAIFSISNTGRTQGKHDLWIRDSIGAVVRGDLGHKELALIFAGDTIAEDVRKIGDILKQNNIQASFFLTGNFLKNPKNKPIVQMLVKDGHYLGPHSDTNQKYIVNEKLDTVAVSFDDFRRDLHDNFKHLASYGVEREGATFFLTPSELYNQTIVAWASSLKLHLINGSPETLEHLTSRSDSAYKTSEEIYRSILEHEQKDRYGLNGSILVFDIASSTEEDHAEFHQHLQRLIQQLDHRGYRFVEINELLD
jgi:endoglucanase